MPNNGLQLSTNENTCAHLPLVQLNGRAPQPGPAPFGYQVGVQGQFYHVQWAVPDPTQEAAALQRYEPSQTGVWADLKLAVHACIPTRTAGA